jgi:hypothetical protein
MASGASAFNRIPPQCQGLCELSQADVDRHSIVLTLGCKGPSYEGPDSVETVRIVGGEIVHITPDTRSVLGRAACTNPGFNMWLQSKKEQLNTD